MNKGNFGLVDYTSLMELETRKQSIFEAMGLINEMNTTYLGANETGCLFERVTDGEDAILAKARGGDRNYAGRENAQMEYFGTSFFPLDGKITAQDRMDLRQLGTENEPEGAENRVRRMVKRINSSQSVQLQKAMLYAIVNDKTYAPGLTATEKTFATVWSAPRTQVANTVFDLTDAAVDPFTTLEKYGRRVIINKAGDNADGYEIVFACEPDVFDGLISHPKFEASYSQYASVQEPLRERIAGNRNNRVFKHKGVIVLEVIASAAGSIPANKGYMFPLGIADQWQLKFGPADTVRELSGQDTYLFMKEDDRKITVESESSFVIVNTRSELICEFTAQL